MKLILLTLTIVVTLASADEEHVEAKIVNAPPNLELHLAKVPISASEVIDQATSDSHFHPHQHQRPVIQRRKIVAPTSTDYQRRMSNIKEAFFRSIRSIFVGTRRSISRAFRNVRLRRQFASVFSAASQRRSEAGELRTTDTITGQSATDVFKVRNR